MMGKSMKFHKPLKVGEWTGICLDCGRLLSFGKVFMNNNKPRAGYVFMARNKHCGKGK